MAYFKHKEPHGDFMVAVNGIRSVRAISANPIGGAPRSDSGKIYYEDGTLVEVSKPMAVALQDHLGKTEVTQEEGE